MMLRTRYCPTPGRELLEEFLQKHNRSCPWPPKGLPCIWACTQAAWVKQHSQRCYSNLCSSKAFKAMGRYDDMSHAWLICCHCRCHCYSCGSSLLTLAFKGISRHHARHKGFTDNSCLEHLPRWHLQLSMKAHCIRHTKNWRGGQQRWNPSRKNENMIYAGAMVSQGLVPSFRDTGFLELILSLSGSNLNK